MARRGRSRPAKSSGRATLERLRSGIPRLDDILNGGFLVGNTCTVVGPPGSGKTIFANQVCFTHLSATPAARALYVTLLAESHAKMLRHLSRMSFFDTSFVRDGRLRYLSGYGPLRSGGASGLLDVIRQSIKRERASVLVIDGVQAVRHCADARAYEELIHELQAFATFAGCTTLLLAPAAASLDAPEHVLVDGVIELSYRLSGPRAVRELAVHKFRGSDYLLGKHEVQIAADGVQVHPRTEIQFDEPEERASEERVRMAFGLPALDRMLRGGLLSGTATTLLGSPGTGKTLLGLSFLVEGARRGQRGTYFGFYEPPPRLIEKAENIGIPLAKHCKSGMVRILWQPPLEHYMDALAEQLIEPFRQPWEPRRRLFVDGIEGFRLASVYPDRMPRFVSAVTNQLRMLDVTTVVSEELDLFKPEIVMPNPELATVNEGVILSRYVEVGHDVRRLLSILKMRESEYDTTIRELRISNDGVSIGEPMSAEEGALSGSARTLRGRTR